MAIGENYTENLEVVINFYNTYIDKHKTVTQLDMFKEEFKKRDKLKGMNTMIFLSSIWTATSLHYSLVEVRY